jgi:hypothetical protein
MSTRSELLASIADTIKDYGDGKIAASNTAHVERWVKQFAADVQLPILSELDHVLKHTYLNRKTVTKFLTSLITNAKLTGADPCAFWRGVKFLNNQGGGNSQREMLALFDSFLLEHCGVRVANCGENTTTFIYIDDAIFTGNRVLKDLTDWIRTAAPAKAKVHIVTMAFHRGGQHYAETKIAEVAAAATKEVTLKWWRCVELEDRRTHVNTSDVLRPRSLGNDPLVAAYAASLKYPTTFRTQDGIGEHKFFSSENGRALLEQEFLKAGVKIRSLCPLLNKYQRPLGNMVLETLGFGSTIVTFRNCPNNAPLALWAGDPWRPLFPRKTN